MSDLPDGDGDEGDPRGVDEGSDGSPNTGDGPADDEPRRHQQEQQQQQ